MYMTHIATVVSSAQKTKTKKKTLSNLEGCITCSASAQLWWKKVLYYWKIMTKTLVTESSWMINGVYIYGICDLQITFVGLWTISLVHMSDFCQAWKLRNYVSRKIESGTVALACSTEHTHRLTFAIALYSSQMGLRLCTCSLKKKYSTKTRWECWNKVMLLCHAEALGSWGLEGTQLDCCLSQNEASSRACSLYETGGGCFTYTQSHSASLAGSLPF